MKRFSERSPALAVVLFLVWLCAGPALQARASVAVLLEQPYGGMAGMNPAGHSAIYLDHVCAESLTKLRACGPGELGVVISRYKDVGGYDWLAMPLVAYLYAVDSVDEMPATIDHEAEIALREAYRKRHLRSVAPDRADGSPPEGNWYQLAGSAYDRTLYGFQVKTNALQDAALIASFNDRKNTDHFNGMFHNCADFSRVTINHFYPHAVRRNYIADLGMTSPKQVARGLAKYGAKHPEAELSVFVVPQVDGSLPRSHKNKCLTESLLTSKRYIVPITVLQPIASAAVLAAYVSVGRFSLPKDAPVFSVREMEAKAEALGRPTIGAAPDAKPPSAPVLVNAGFASTAEGMTGEPEY